MPLMNIKQKPLLALFILNDNLSEFVVFSYANLNLYHNVRGNFYLI